MYYHTWLDYIIIEISDFAPCMHDFSDSKMTCIFIQASTDKEYNTNSYVCVIQNYIYSVHVILNTMCLQVSALGIGIESERYE